jgi:hypothetical protein
MTRKRWALEGAIADMYLTNILQISSTADESIRERHFKIKDSFDRAIKQAGGISVFTTYGKDDYTYTPPCFIGGTKKEGVEL